MKKKSVLVIICDPSGWSVPAILLGSGDGATSPQQRLVQMHFHITTIHTNWKGLQKQAFCMRCQLCWLRGFLYLAAGGKGKGFMWE